MKEWVRENILHFRRCLRGMTLIELVVVVITIAILVSIAVPQYTKAVERARDKEAIVNLKLMQAAEKIYHMDTGDYFAPKNILSHINTTLRLDLNNLLWSYRIRGNTGNYTAQALRNEGGYNRTYRITDSDDAAICSGGCP